MIWTHARVLDHQMVLVQSKRVLSLGGLVLRRQFGNRGRGSVAVGSVRGRLVDVGGRGGFTS